MEVAFLSYASLDPFEHVILPTLLLHLHAFNLSIPIIDWASHIIILSWAQWMNYTLSNTESESWRKKEVPYYSLFLLGPHYLATPGLLIFLFGQYLFKNLVDNMAFQPTPMDISIIITTASTADAAPGFATERRVTPTWTVMQLKSKLETMTGVPPSSQRLRLKAPGQPDQWMKGDDRIIGDWGLTKGCEVEVWFFFEPFFPSFPPFPSIRTFSH